MPHEMPVLNSEGVRTTILGIDQGEHLRIRFKNKTPPEVAACRLLACIKRQIVSLTNSNPDRSKEGCQETLETIVDTVRLPFRLYWAQTSGNRTYTLLASRGWDKQIFIQLFGGMLESIVLVTRGKEEATAPTRN